jgi:hypothetical protein
MFIRIKKVNGKYYAYNVHNKRVNGKVKQKVKSYLGKAIVSKKIADIDFISFVKKDFEVYINEKSFREIVYDLILWELFRHGLNDISINTKRYNITQNNNVVVLKLNDGYLSDKTLSNLLKFHAVGDDEYFIGKEFAEVFVKAGIDVPKEIFVKLFEKLIKR